MATFVVKRTTNPTVLINANCKGEVFPVHAIKLNRGVKV